MVNISIPSKPMPVETTKTRTKTLGLGALTALVIGSMVGAGVFSLPQNMADGAGGFAILIGWGITGVGMLALAFVYLSLAQRKPQLEAGPYAYARAGFGPFIGFNSAWGYWLSAWLGNVSYAVILFGALGYFYSPFGEGNTLPALVGASVVLWAVHYLVLAGVRQAAVVNTIATVAKLAPIVLFIVFAVLAFRVDLFRADFWAPDLGGLFDQVKSTMLVTLWVFIGIEGASVMSARAGSRREIGTATMAGFLTCLVLYALVSLLSQGAMSQAELAALPNPSMAGVLEHLVGSWGAVLVSIAVVVSVLGAFLAWTIFAAEIPFVASRDGTMPKLFAGENEKGSPSTSLWITNGLVQAFLVVAYFQESTYQALFYIASTAILVPYVFSGAYAAKLAITGESYAPGENRVRDMLLGLLATGYGAWLVYAAGVQYLLMCALLYAPGIAFYALARRERGERFLSFYEALIAVALVAAAALAAWLMWSGAISPL